MPTTAKGGVPPQDDFPGESERATRWLSRGFEELIFERQARDESGADFDVVIVGSGYGGAVAAAELSARGGPDKTVCVLERGREYLQGSFPTRMADLASHVRFTSGDAAQPRGYREGLFDVRVGKDVSVVVGNGVGGGSLINAGVMLMPTLEVFDDTAWPEELRGKPGFEEVERCSNELKTRLGATHTMKDTQGPKPHKYGVLQRLSPGHFDAVPITVALADGTRTSAGVSMDTCVRCGDCATGCNHNAKLSLDVTLLAEAVRNGAQLFAGATLLRIEKQPRKGLPPLWALHLVHTEENLRRRQGKPFVLRAERVVLAAGTLGSTEILMRSQTEGLRFSPRLGHRFSANGDMIAAAYDTQAGPVDGVGDESVTPEDVPAADRVGPTITGMVDLRGDASPMAVQDLGVPGALRRLFEEVVTTSESLRLLGEGDEKTHHPDDPASGDPCAIDAERVRKSLLVVMMSRDPAEGRMEMTREALASEAGDGAISIHWPGLRDHPPFLAQHDALQGMLDKSIRGQVLANPIWRPLPAKLDFLLEGTRGPLLTVHPLGGCPMGDSAFSGVVDHCGRVFDAGDAEGSALHEGLVVLDGSVIPTSLGINPALTIASVASRAVKQLCEQWGFTGSSEQKTLPPRPWFRRPAAREKARATMVEVVERLSGPLKLSSFDGEVHAELTMRFDPIDLRRLTVPGAELQLAPARGKLRIFDAAPLGEEEKKDDDCSVLLVAEVSGSLRVFHREASTPLDRRLRGLGAWIPNRGLRDTVLWLIDRISGDAPSVQGGDAGSVGSQALDRARSAWHLSSRAGAVRLMSYDLKIQKILRSQSEEDMPQAVALFLHQAIKGTKRLTYSRRGNPWRQLMEVKLDAFPGLAPDAPDRMLRLDSGYLARQGIPLLRIVDQQDQPGALVDLASLGLYMLRILLHVHVWSFRAPDKPKPRKIDRFPGKVEGLPPPEVFELRTGTMEDGSPVFVRLTRYGFDKSRKTRIETPVLLIHGYSASGTTFAHHAVRPNLASALWDAGRDVWIVDMRTSAAMPHARHPWSFEEVARADIPVAIDHILRITGRKQVDVFAHCMGSAMLAMALLGRRDSKEDFWALRKGLHAKIRSLVISQVAPAMIFTPANVFRAFAMRYLNHYLPLDNYQFRVSDTPGLAEQLTDRLLATLPYPVSEFDRENPLWTPWRRTPWAATRRRMDALYGRDFSLNNMSDEMLDHIDDHFGPLSLQTVSQVIHFARFKSIANQRGFNEFLDPENLRENYDFPVMCVHGKDNGLVSVQTLDHFREVMADATRTPVRLEPIEDFGHQDCLIGTGAIQVFEKVIGFFDDVEATTRPPAPELPTSGEDVPPGAGINAPQEPIEVMPPVFACQVPAFGLRLDIEAPSTTIVFSTGDHGGKGKPFAGIFTPVAWREERLLIVRPEGNVEPSEASLRDVCLATQPKSEGTGVDTRLTFSFLRPPLPQGADGWLVLLMYRQSESIGLFEPNWPDELISLEEVALQLLGIRLPVLRLPPVGLKPAPIPDKGSGPAMTRSVLRAFEKSTDAMLESGILRPPSRSLVGVSAADDSMQGSTTIQPLTPIRSFVLASCQYPGGMLDRTPPGTPEDGLPGPSDASYLRLRERLRATSSDVVPSFLVLAGDQVYVDATAGLFDPRGLDDQFRLPYESFLGSRGARSVLGRLPAYMVLDDHEIVDNWEEERRDATPRLPLCNQELLRHGVTGFLHYQRNQEIAPDPHTKSLPDKWPNDANPLFTPMVIDGLSFFLADSRTERKSRLAVDAHRADLMRIAQVRKINKWLEDRSGDGPRFFVSSAMVLPRQLGSRSEGHAVTLRSDAWDGYPVALHRLLAGVYERGTDDVVFLSGDAHLGNFTRIELTRSGSERKVVAHSVHCPALYAPYPFANAVAEDFARSDDFEFVVRDSLGEDRKYRCVVRSWFPEPGDGFAMLRVEKKDQAWRIDVEFDRAGRADGVANSAFDFEVPDATD